MYILLTLFGAIVSYFFWIQCIYYRQNSAKSRKHLLRFMLCRDKQIKSSQTSDLTGDVRALFLTAHPDDECMFFAPAILRLVELNASVHLLCLSQGGFTMNNRFCFSLVICVAYVFRPTTRASFT